MNYLSSFLLNPAGRKKTISFFITVILILLFAGANSFAQLTTVWEKSFSNGNRPVWLGTTNGERGIAYGNVGGNDRIFVAGNTFGKNVIILNAATGDSIGVLDTTGIALGTVLVNDVEVSSDGIIFACNLTTSATTTAFKVYKWSSEAAAPVVVIQYTGGAYRLGDKFSVFGSTADNSIAIYAVVASSNRYLKFTTTDNGVTFTSEEIIISGLAATATGGSPQITPIATGGFYLNGGAQQLREINATNTLVGAVDANIVPTGSNALRSFSYGGKNYVVNFLNGVATSTTSTTAFFERAFVLDVTNGFANVSNVGFTTFLGSTANANGTGDVAFKNNGDGTFAVYVLSTNNGIGAYTFNAVTASAILTPPTDPQTFAAYWPPANWRRYSGFLTDNSVLTSVTATWVPDDFGNVTAPVNRSARINIFGTTIRNWFVTPTINLGSGSTNYQLDFDIALTAYATTNPGTLGIDDTLAVVISTDNGVTWSNTNIIKLYTSSTPISTTGEGVSIPLTGYTGLVKIGFYGASSVSNADNDLFIDNVAVNEISLSTVDWCNLQWPPSGTVTQGDALTVYAQAWINGVTSIPGPTPDLLSWIGISSTDTDPSTWTTWIPAVFNVDAGNNDEFMADIGANLAPGSYYYASRFQYQNGPYSYGGLTGFWVPGQSGALTVNPFVISVLPYNEGFESITFPPTGWVREDLNAANTWQRATATPFSGTAHARYAYSITTAADDWLITPGIVMDAAKTYRITYHYRVQSATYPESMKISIGDAQNAAGMDSVLFDHPSLTNITYLSNSVIYSPDVSGTYYVGFHAYSIANMWNLDLDNITISEVLDIDYGVTALFQIDAIPSPFKIEVLNGATYEKGESPETEFKLNSSIPVSASDVNNSRMMNYFNSNFYGEKIEAIQPVILNAVVRNLGLQSPTYNLEWSVGGLAGTPIARPGIVFDGVDTVVLATTPLERGTLTSVANAVVTNDGDPTNNTRTLIRTLVYPDTMIRIRYDNGPNTPNTFIGFGTNNLPVTAGVRFTASADMQLANIDAFYRQELNADSILVRVWAAGDTTTAPGQLLYSKKFAGENYIVPGEGGAYITFPLGEDAPAFLEGSDFWVSISFSAEVQFPMGAHNSPLTTPGRSFISADAGLNWSPLVITTERAWLLRVVGIPYEEPIPPFVTLWERSAANSTLPTWFSTASNERGLGYGKTSDGADAINDRLFVVSRTGGTFVKVINAATGADVSDLNTAGITGGLILLNDVDVTDDGKILACNVAQNNNFKVYMWDNELSAPIVALEKFSVNRIGDKFTVVGNYSAGTAQIWAASATTGQHLVYKWTMAGGVFDSIPQVIVCSDALVSGIGSAAVGPLPNGDFYWNANGQSARKYSATGTLIGIIPGGIIATGSNAVRYLGEEGGNEYVAIFAYGSGNENIRIVEVPLGDPTQATLYAVTPALGTNANGNGLGDVEFQVNPDFTVNVFALSTNNGLGAYRSTSVLPVELTSFAASVIDRTVTLKWRTESESNSHGFEIEKRSNQSGWNTIGFVKSAGNSTQSQNYSFVDSKVETGSYLYRLKMIDLDGTFSYSTVIEVEVGTPTTFSLSQNYPNPFNPTTRIDYQVPFSANVQIELYSITGEKVASLVNGELAAGFYSLDINAATLRLSSGVYFYRMISTDIQGSKFVDTKKMVLLK